jgi:hypothetical protein
MGLRTIPSICLLLAFQASLLTAENDHSESTDPSGVSDVVRLDDEELDESSGLGISNRRPGFFWSHNDSGDEARLFAFDRTGKNTGQVKLTSADSDDWEDMASFVHQGVARLLIADSGDNDSKRSGILLHLFDEPDPTKRVRLGDREIQTLRLTYEDGPRDCEAVAVDVTRGMIILVSKARLPLCGVYTVPLPDRDESGDDLKVTAKKVKLLPIPMVTALDIDPVNGDLWLVSYFHAICFRCSDRKMSLQQQLAALPDTYELPRWKQIEAVAVDRAHNVWVTSEGKHAPLGRLSPESLAGQRTTGIDH